MTCFFVKFNMDGKPVVWSPKWRSSGGRWGRLMRDKISETLSQTPVTERIETAAIMAKIPQFDDYERSAMQIDVSPKGRQILIWFKHFLPRSLLKAARKCTVEGVTAE